MVSEGDNKFQKMTVMYYFYDCWFSFGLLKVCEEDFHQIAEHCRDTNLDKTKFTYPPPRLTGHSYKLETCYSVNKEIRFCKKDSSANSSFMLLLIRS